MGMSNIILFVVLTISAYMFFTTLFNTKVGDTLQDLIVIELQYSMISADKIGKSVNMEFEAMSSRQKMKSKKYKYYMFINELLLDNGWSSFGITPERFTMLNAIFSLVSAGVLGLIAPNLVLIAYVAVIIFVLDIAIIFSASRYKAKVRLRRILAGENLVCGNISQGLEEAIKMNLDLFEGNVKEAFEEYLYRDQYMHWPVEKNIAQLNVDLGEHSTGFCKRLLLFEKQRRPGQVDMFRFVMQENIREEERLTKRELTFQEMNLQYLLCSIIVIVFLVACLGSMPEVLEVAKTLAGKIIIIFTMSSIALGFVLNQAIQTKRFIFTPEVL